MMEMFMTKSHSLVAAGNTYNPSLLVLKEKGYDLEREEEGDTVLWRAIKGDCSFTGYSPPELLGIVSLWEAFGETWNRQLPDLLTELAEQSDPD
jgi:hypothetical protein